jgi:hypothetical protein
VLLVVAMAEEEILCVVSRPRRVFVSYTMVTRASTSSSGTGVILLLAPVSRSPCAEFDLRFLAIVHSVKPGVVTVPGCRSVPSEAS